MPLFVTLVVSLRPLGRILLPDVECLNWYPCLMAKGVKESYLEAARILGKIYVSIYKDIYTHTKSGGVTPACPGTHCTCCASVSQPSNLELKKPPSYKRPKETYFILLPQPGGEHALCLSRLPPDP